MDFKLTEITFSKIKGEVEFYLKDIYNKASQIFSPASPYGQILRVIQELHQLSILYLKNAINQFDLSNNNVDNYDIIQSAAVVAGHNPSRAVSSSGTIKVKLKSSSSLSEIPQNKIKVLNKTTLKNNTNSLLYHIDLGGSDEEVFNIDNGSAFFLTLAQGEWKNDEFTGTGQPNQSFEVVPEDKEIENHKIEVSVNNVSYEVKNHLYEMEPQENAVVVRTSFNGGASILFGNENFGNIPPVGSRIRVDYVATDGARGNIFRRTTNDFKLVDDILGGDGVSIDFEKFFDIFIETDITFGVDKESLELTKSLIPLNTNNFVLALPKQYSYAIRRLGVFSYVNAYQENQTINIVATPNVRIFKNKNSDYFTVDERAFRLDNFERSKLDEYLKKSGFIQLTQKYRITGPKLSFYVMFINLRIFDDVNEDNVKNQIIESISEYFLDLKRTDRIPRNEIISIISQLNGVDSVDVRFVSKKNEDYHKEYLRKDANSRIVNGSSQQVQRKDYQPETILGLDPLLGDIVFEPQEFPIIRGGWSDRNDIFFSEKPLEGFSSINIKIEGVTRRDDTRR